jgi:cytidine deaminase
VELDQGLVDAAAEVLARRWPGAEYAVAAAVYLDDGRILRSVGLDNLNSAASLCAETGALCQAYTLDRRVTASACVARLGDTVTVLAPCGICQERLALWGPDVQVAVADEEGGWVARRLAELNPYYWGTRFTDDGGWPSTDAHRG